MSITWGLIVLLCWMPAINITAFFIVSNKPFNIFNKFKEWYEDVHSWGQAILRLLVLCVFAPLYLLPFGWTLEIILGIK